MRLHSVALPSGARAIGRSLAWLGLPEMGAEIAALRRGRSDIVVTSEAVLQAGDIVVLRGAADAISRAEGRLLQAWTSAGTSQHSDEDF